MAITLHHLIVPAKDKRASAQLFAEIFGLTVKPSEGRFAQVPVDEHLTIDFADDEHTRGILHFVPEQLETRQGRGRRQRAAHGDRRPDRGPPWRPGLLFPGAQRPSVGSDDCVRATGLWGLSASRQVDKQRGGTPPHARQSAAVHVICQIGVPRSTHSFAAN